MRASRWVVTLALVIVAAATAAAAPVERTYNAPVDRVWTTTEAVLKHLGWDVDKADRAIGFITTDSRRVEGENYGVYEKGLRHRLQLLHRLRSALAEGPALPPAREPRRQQVLDVRRGHARSPAHP